MKAVQFVARKHVNELANLFDAEEMSGAIEQGTPMFETGFVLDPYSRRPTPVLIPKLTKGLLGIEYPRIVACTDDCVACPDIYDILFPAEFWRLADDDLICLAIPVKCLIMVREGNYQGGQDE